MKCSGPVWTVPEVLFEKKQLITALHLFRRRCVLGFLADVACLRSLTVVSLSEMHCVIEYKSTGDAACKGVVAMNGQQSRQQEWQEHKLLREWQEVPNSKLVLFDRLAHGDTSVTTEVAPWDIAREKPPWAEMTIDVVIPAFNEGSCIEGLLHDVMMARQDDWFQMQNIYVISDASTDRTDDIVQKMAARDPRITLIRKPERKGKQDSINLAFSVTNADVIVFIDADVMLASEDSITKLVQHFRDGNVAVVQGALVHPRPGFTLHPAKVAGYFDWLLVDRIRRQKAISWWSIDARVMALSRDFYQHLVLPPSLADDQFIFYSCIQQGRGFVWADDAIFYYGAPESIADFSHQWSRYFFYTSKSRQYFGKDLIDRDMSVPGLWQTILSTFFRHPFCGLMWVLCFAISRVEFMLGVDFDRYERGFFWTKSSPLTNIGQTHGWQERG